MALLVLLFLEKTYLQLRDTQCHALWRNHEPGSALPASRGHAYVSQYVAWSLTPLKSGINLSNEQRHDNVMAMAHNGIVTMNMHTPSTLGQEIDYNIFGPRSSRLVGLLTEVILC